MMSVDKNSSFFIYSYSMVSGCKGSGIDLNQGLHIVILGEQIVKIEFFRPFFVIFDFLSYLCNR